MNSSSAFGNVLSASLVQPAANAAASRSLTDDGNSPAFKRALADVRAERDTKPTEPCAKKLAADKPAKTKAAPDNATDKTTANENPIASSPKKAGKAEAKAGQEDTATVAEEIKNVENSEPLLTLDGLPLPQMPLDASVAVTELAAPVEGEVASLDSPAPEVAAVSPAVAANTAPVTLDLAQPAAQEADAQVPSAAITPLIDPQATAVAAVVTVPEAIAAAGLAPLKNVEAKLAPTADAAVADDALLTGDDQLASTDPKVVFEKMLQAIASNAGNGNSGGDPQKDQDLAATLATLTSAPAADTPATAPGIESLARGPDVQLPSARSFVVQTAVPVSVGQPSWSQAVGEKVLWLAAQNVQSAEIRLDPPELGPMQVKVSVQQEQTSITFTSHNAGVRDLLDQSLGRLRDMFNEQGLNLVNVDVSDKSFQRQQGDGSEQQGQGACGEPDEEETLQAVSAIVQQRLVDHYA